jgi:hypothetical protein
MYVVGVMADLEASLRATAQATSKAPYGVASARRAANLKRKLLEIYDKTGNPRVEQALDAALEAPLKISQSESLMHAAQVIGEAAYAFAQEANGNDLAAIDPMLPPPNTYK